jgi:hypothetical protein
MTPEDLFQALDCDGDGALSRTDLRQGAQQLGWHWPEAPLYAVLDHLSIRTPLRQGGFVDALQQISRDPHGPYGGVLRRSPLFKAARIEGCVRSVPFEPDAPTGPVQAEDLRASHATLLQHLAGVGAADDYRSLLDRLEMPEAHISCRRAAVLVIDPQRSFTSGAWAQSAGADAGREVEPIRLAFERCGMFLQRNNGRTETMFTRCSFPPDSYDWDERVAGAIDAAQLYFVKPGNNALWPPTNGVREWLDQLAGRGQTTVVIGGCTLNSCVRVSAAQIQRYAGRRGLQVVVDLGLCGARTRNYVRSEEFGGISAVESAVREMIGARVRVAEGVRWE